MTPKRRADNKEQAKRKHDVRYRIEELQQRDKSLTYERLSLALRYTNKNYISQILMDSGAVSDLFLNRFDPYYNEKMAGPKAVNDDEPPYLRKFEHPFMECDYVYRMKGDSMEPKIPNGSEVGVKRLPSDSIIINNEIYLIATKSKFASLRCVNALPDQPETLELSTYNKEVAPTFVKAGEIEAIYKAEFVLRFL